MKTSILKIRKLMFIYFCKHNRNLMNEEFSTPKMKMIKKTKKTVFSKISKPLKKKILKPEKIFLKNQKANKIDFCV